MFWCRTEGRSAVVESLEQVRLVQLAICHDTDFCNLEADQQWFAKAVDSARGRGVRVLMSMTQAMFTRGEPDLLRSLEGGPFVGELATKNRGQGWGRVVAELAGYLNGRREYFRLADTIADTDTGTDGHR